MERREKEELARGRGDLTLVRVLGFQSVRKPQKRSDQCQPALQSAVCCDSAPSLSPLHPGPEFPAAVPSSHPEPQLPSCRVLGK